MQLKRTGQSAFVRHSLTVGIVHQYTLRPVRTVRRVAFIVGKQMLLSTSEPSGQSVAGLH